MSNLFFGFPAAWFTVPAIVGTLFFSLRTALMFVGGGDTGLDADVDFNSLSGDFDTDFDISVRSRRSRWIGSRVRGTIGDGGRELSFNTVSGDVQLRRARSRRRVAPEPPGNLA